MIIKIMMVMIMDIVIFSSFLIHFSSEQNNPPPNRLTLLRQTAPHFRMPLLATTALLARRLSLTPSLRWRADDDAFAAVCGLR